MKCDSCLYDKFCVPENRNGCSEYVDARRYTKHEWCPGDEAFCIFAGGIYHAHITRSSRDIVCIGESEHEFVCYYLIVNGTRVDRKWLVNGSVTKDAKLYKWYKDAEEALNNERR